MASEPPAKPCVDDERLVPPEQAVVHQHELGAQLHRPLEQLARAGDAARDRAHLGRADDLEALRRELRKTFDLEEPARVRHDLVPGRHGASLRNREPLPFRGSGCGAAW